MPAPDYHAWTHRPKALGGTDPIEMPTGGGLPCAIGDDGNISRATNQALPMHFISWNDPMFGYAVVSGSSPNKTAKYITCPPGHYQLDCVVFWGFGDFPGGSFPYIQPWCYFPSGGGSEDVVANTLDVRSLDDTQGIIYGEQFTTAELDHHALASTQIFSWDTAMTGETTMGFGVALRESSGGGNRSWGGMVSLVRLGEVVVEQTIT